MVPPPQVSHLEADKISLLIADTPRGGLPQFHIDALPTMKQFFSFSQLQEINATTTFFSSSFPSALGRSEFVSRYDMITCC